VLLVLKVVLLGGLRNLGGLLRALFRVLPRILLGVLEVVPLGGLRNLGGLLRAFLRTRITL